MPNVLRSSQRRLAGLVLGLLLLYTLLEGRSALPAWPGEGTNDAAKDSPQEGKSLGGDGDGDPLPGGTTIRLGTLRWRHPGRVLCLAYAPDGKTLASAGEDQTIRFWEAATGREWRRVANPA